MKGQEWFEFAVEEKMKKEKFVQCTIHTPLLQQMCSNIRILH